HFVRLGFQPAKIALDAVPRPWPLMRRIFSVLGISVQHPVLPFLRQVAERHIHRNVTLAAKCRQVRLTFGALTGLPRLDHALGERLGTVRQRQIVIDGNDPPKPATRRTSADRMIETEQGRGGLAILNIALGAMQPVGEEMRSAERGMRSWKRKNAQLAFPVMISLFASLDEARPIGRNWFDAVLDDREVVGLQLAQTRQRFF